MIKEIRKVKDALGKLSFILSKEQKKYCVLIFLMSLVAALLETVGVSAIIPVIQAVISVDQLMQSSYINPFIELFHLKTSREVIIFICVAVGLIYILKNAYTLFYTWASAKFSNKIRRELATRTLRTYMKQGYIFFVENNSSKLIRGISSDVNSVQTVVTQLFSVICKALIILCMTLFVVVQSPILAVGILCLVAGCFVISQVVFRKPMRRYGEASREYGFQASRASLEAIQGSKEVLVSGRQEYFVNEYLKNMIEFNKVEVKNAVASVAPTNLIEVTSVIALLAVVVVQTGLADASSDFLTQMIAIALAAFRILPALGTLLGNVNLIVFHTPGLASAVETLKLVNDLDNGTGDGNVKRLTSSDGERIRFERELRLSDICYAYPRMDKNVVNHLSLTICKGTSIGLIGTSGAGKTTLADIILGLLKPQSGEITIDGINVTELEQKRNKLISYVPQSVYMTDASVRRNVAFGVEESLVDDNKVWKALEMAQLKDFIESLPMGIETNVGERGVQLSGGQRQRIAIARALYNDPDIIVLDEATAALDTETERAVMESIEALQKVKTLIIVAHRLTTIKQCDQIYEIVNGKAVLRTKEEIFGENN